MELHHQTWWLNKGNWTSFSMMKVPDASCLVVHIEKLVLVRMCEITGLRTSLQGPKSRNRFRITSDNRVKIVAARPLQKPSKPTADRKERQKNAKNIVIP